MRTTYKKEDVTLLLKDISGLVKPMTVNEREQLIQQGVHYSGMLPKEDVPSERYMKEYLTALNNYSSKTALALKNVSEKLYKKKGKDLVIVSLARAGTPVGILIKRYLNKKYSFNPPHYSISIIRGIGIDKNALNYIIEHHGTKGIQFVDGWTGKGAILRELNAALDEYKEISKDLAVLADPANMTELCGTHDDFLIPCSCLNSVVSGLFSRTFFDKTVIGSKDFHGAAFFENLLPYDRSYEFINEVEKHLNDINDNETNKETLASDITGLDEVKSIAEKYNIKDINFIKPGIGETTRVLLRRIPDLVLIKKGSHNHNEISHILELAHEKNIDVMEYPLKNYKACGIIKNLHSDI